ncbi:MAG: hypothetical protein ACI4SQ_06475 [Eubacterium sp.]
MAVVVAVLKTIGIIVLVLLALCLLLLCAALFVPVRYRITAKTTETVELRCQASWLFHIVYIVRETQKEKTKIRIFGIPFTFFRRSDKKKKKVKNESVKEKMDLETEDSLDERVQPNPLAKDSIPEEKLHGKQMEKKKKREKKGFSFDKISSIITFIKNPANKRGFGTVKKEIFSLLRYVSPDEVKGKIVFGTGDPCTTGWLLGAVSMLPVAYTEGLHICPAFEEKQFQADGYVKGKARLIYVVRLVIRGYLNPDIKRWIDQGFGK